MEHFGMESLDSTPTQNFPVVDLSRTHLNRRLNEYNKTMDGLMKMVCSPLTFEEVKNFLCRFK